MVDRNYISDCVFDCIPDGRFFVGPILFHTPKYTYEDENLRLIEDLEMDSMDISSIIYDVCSMVGIDCDRLDKARKLDTVRDLIDLVWNEYQKKTENGK